MAAVTLEQIEALLDRKLEEKLEQKLEEKLEEKLDKKLDEKLSPVLDRLTRIEVLHEALDDKVDRLIEVSYFHFSRLLSKEEVDQRFEHHENRLAALEALARR